MSNIIFWDPVLGQIMFETLFQKILICYPKLWSNEHHSLWTDLISFRSISIGGHVP